MALKTILSSSVHKLSNLIWPPRSLLSDKRVEHQGTIEAELWSELPFIAGPICFCCGVPMEGVFHPESLCGVCMAQPPAFDKARAVLAYDDLTRPLVLALKHGGRKDGVKLFAIWMAEITPNIDDLDLIVPVPAHWTRLFARGYNQAAWLAQALSKQCAKPWRPDVLIRQRKTGSQNGLSLKGRQRNVQGAFRVKGRLDGMKILLVDDVYTTGSTLEACAKVLKRAGANQICSVSLLRVCKPKTINDIDEPILEKLNA
ncbi:MAG: putative phosphoribosyl transferase [Hyphomonadaceae bacterium]|nr:MAG: putative phosphoribosyl transferase [Hyphomonadaceae bacterium]KAF0186886.1 MAG: putative phosphoribosyl transferase [Hyphomonadaceae bacterium]